MKYKSFGESPGKRKKRQRRHKSGGSPEPLDHSRMTYMWEANKKYPVLVIYPHKAVVDYFGTSRVVCEHSEDNQWVLLRKPRDKERGVKLRQGKEARRPYVHIPVYLDEIVLGDKPIHAVTCEARFVEQEQGWEFRLVDFIRIPAVLKVVAS